MDRGIQIDATRKRFDKKEVLITGPIQDVSGQALQAMTLSWIPEDWA